MRKEANPVEEKEPTPLEMADFIRVYLNSDTFLFALREPQSDYSSREHDKEMIERAIRGEDKGGFAAEQMKILYSSVMTIGPILGKEDTQAWFYGKNEGLAGEVAPLLVFPEFPYDVLRAAEFYRDQYM